MNNIDKSSESEELYYVSTCNFSERAIKWHNTLTLYGWENGIIDIKNYPLQKDSNIEINTELSEGFSIYTEICSRIWSNGGTTHEKYQADDKSMYLKRIVNGKKHDIIITNPNVE